MPIDIQVRNLGRHPKGYWIAEVNGMPVHRKWGSWTIGHAGNDPNTRDVLPPVAAELQRQVKKLERKEAR